MWGEWNYNRKLTHKVKSESVTQSLKNMSELFYDNNEAIRKAIERLLNDERFDIKKLQASCC